MTKERVTVFIDAVLAIVMTILVLELKAPDQVTMAGFLGASGPICGLFH
ncbi:TMEM175 family protein [Lacticaseibacillus thailandensis]|nr:TMEM175 family protein [Lacticaseibacillus thailandensis]